MKKRRKFCECFGRDASLVEGFGRDASLTGAFYMR
jgi:hypothetical protein